MKKDKRTVYYKRTDDDFAGNNIKTKPVGSSFVYIRKNPLWRLGSFLIYRVIAFPIVFVVCKVVFGLRIKNRKAVKDRQLYLRQSYPSAGCVYAAFGILPKAVVYCNFSRFGIHSGAENRRAHARCYTVTRNGIRHEEYGVGDKSPLRTGKLHCYFSGGAYLALLYRRAPL